MESSGRLPYDLREMQASGAKVLREGLTPFPAVLTPSTTTPLAYWKNETYGFVIFLTGVPVVPSLVEPPGAEDGKNWSGGYDWKNTEWVPTPQWCGSIWQGIQGPPGIPDDPEEGPVRWNGQVIDETPEEGRPVVIVWGWCSKEVVQLSFVQSEEKSIIPIGHLGSWVIGSESGEPWTVEAYDGAGNGLGWVTRHQWSE